MEQVGGERMEQVRIEALRQAPTARGCANQLAKDLLRVGPSAANRDKQSPAGNATRSHSTPRLRLGLRIACPLLSILPAVRVRLTLDRRRNNNLPKYVGTTSVQSSRQKEWLICP